MGALALADLVVAVSEAGGLGTLGLGGLPPEVVRDEIRRVQGRPRRPFAVNFLVPMLDPAALEAALAEHVPAVTFFYGDVAPWVAAVHRAGARVLVQVGSADEAVRAVDAGADVVIAQGVEAGGHVRGTTS